MSGSGSWHEVLTLADEQWGLVTTQQVERTGLAWSTLARQIRRGVLERVAHGVYRVRGAGEVEQLGLRAAWLQLGPSIPAWDRQLADGAVSHRSAASLFGLGPLPADVHEFTLPGRKQTRRKDVRLHKHVIPDDGWTTHRGLPVTRPRRIAADLLGDGEDPGAIGEVIADALRSGYEDPASVARSIAPYAPAHGFGRGDAEGFLDWLLGLSGDPDREIWIAEAGTDPVDRSRATNRGDLS